MQQGALLLLAIQTLLQLKNQAIQKKKKKIQCIKWLEMENNGG